MTVIKLKFVPYYTVILSLSLSILVGKGYDKDCPTFILNGLVNGTSKYGGSFFTVMLNEY